MLQPPIKCLSYGINEFEKPVGAIGFAVGILSFAVIACLPFSAISSTGFLGNFGANLSLGPFLALAPLLVISGRMLQIISLKTPEATVLRVFLFVMVATSALTIINGIMLSQFDIRAYGTSPLEKSLKTSFVPIFIFALVATLATIAAQMPIRQFQAALKAAFFMTVCYTALQVLSKFVPNPLYDVLKSVLEGARETGDVSYFERFNRINGTTTEPAELAKLMLVLFAPWIVVPISGRMRLWNFLILLILVAATQSIIGLAIATVLVFLIVLSPRLSSHKIRILVIVILYFLTITFIAFGESLFDSLTMRLSNLDDDPSTIIRPTYNGIALSIILENPWLGIGWSNEIFLFPQRVSSISYLWEVQQNLLNGNALTAKSLFLRLVMYMGIPLFLVLVVAIFMGLNNDSFKGNQSAQIRTRLAFLLFAMGGSIDGGIMTSFFLWAGPALALGFQMRKEVTA